MKAFISLLIFWCVSVCVWGQEIYGDNSSYSSYLVLGSLSSGMQEVKVLHDGEVRLVPLKGLHQKG